MPQGDSAPSQSIPHEPECWLSHSASTLSICSGGAAAPSLTYRSPYPNPYPTLPGSRWSRGIAPSGSAATCLTCWSPSPSPWTRTRAARRAALCRFCAATVLNTAACHADLPCSAVLPSSLEGWDWQHHTAGPRPLPPHVHGRPSAVAMPCRCRCWCRMPSVCTRLCGSCRSASRPLQAW